MKKMKLLVFMSTLIIVGFLSFSSCYYDNKQDLYDYVVIPGDSTNCVVDNQSYLNDIVPILDLNCNLACHNATDKQGNIVLVTYAQVNSYVNKGSLLGSIKRQAPYAPMPPSAVVSACNVDKVASWIAAGAPNN